MRVKPVGSVIACLVLGCSAMSRAEEDATFRPCRSDPARLEARSQELQRIVNADQADREHWTGLSGKQTRRMLQRDLARRKRVGEIFGEGCFSKAEDFAAAALVYQHGDVSDHFLQAFIWAKRAVELGGDQKRLMAVTIDRYLVNVGHKQLFATQATKPSGESGTCWCLQPVEPSFPEERRREIGGQTMKEAFVWLDELNEGADCPTEECSEPLESSPAGTIPGFW